MTISSTVITCALRKAGIPRTSLKGFYKTTLAEYGEKYFVAKNSGYRIERSKNSNLISLIFEAKGSSDERKIKIKEYITIAKTVISNLGYKIILEEPNLLQIDLKK